MLTHEQQKEVGVRQQSTTIDSKSNYHNYSQVCATEDDARHSGGPRNATRPHRSGLRGSRHEAEGGADGCRRHRRTHLHVVRGDGVARADAHSVRHDTRHGGKTGQGCGSCRGAGRRDCTVPRREHDGLRLGGHPGRRGAVVGIHDWKEA